MLDNRNNSAIKKEYKYVLLGLLILLGLILFKELRPYLSSFLGAATLYVLLKHQMIYLTTKAKFSRSLSATIITLEALLFFLIPLTGLAFLVIDTLSGVSIDPKEIIDKFNLFIESLEQKMGFDIFTPENLAAIPKWGSNLLQTLGTSIYSLIINSIFILFILFYMLYNHTSFEKMVREVMPFKEENKDILAEETKSIIKANAIGIPLLGIIQGAFAYIGYLFFGVDNALLYGIVTGLASIIPLVGTMVVWIPISIGLLLSGKVGMGIGMALYGLIIIGGVDNVARLFLQKMLADIHPLITIFGVIIGIPMFGFWGVIFGPLLLSLFVLFFNMYRHEYIPGSSAEPRATTSVKPKTDSPPDNSKNE